MSINIPMKNDYSFLFSGLGGNKGSSLSSLLADYASIKNGTYGKLMKAYFNENSSESVKEATKDALSERKNRNASSLSKAETKAYTAVQEATDDLKESADALLKTGTKSLFNKKDITTKDENGVESTTKGYDTNAIYNAVNSFVQDYNSVVKAAASGDVDNNSLTNRVNHMQNTTAINSKALAEVGITVNKDKTLSLDKDTFQKADMGKVQNLFNGTGSYGYSVSSSASMINHTADYALSKANTYTGAGSYHNAFNAGNMFNSYF